ncbi:MAG: hypothetical protein GW899_01515 [Parcubacteria group bacterium]|nr:hypothetical protein [Parcubacteria group bacterium]
MQKIKFIIGTVTIIVIVIVVLANVVLAAESSPQIKLTYPWSEEKSPAGLVSRFYKIALGLAGAAALGVLIYGAILWTVSGAVTSKQDALEWIKGALWGLVLLLGAYLILWTINPDLVNLKSQEELFKPIAPGTATTITPTPGTSTDAQIRQNLSQISGGKITVNYPEPRTSLNGLRDSTISGVLSLWNSCGKCDLVITAGTETAYHAPGKFGHASGYKVDLRPTDDLNSAIYNRIATSCRIPPPANTNCAGLDGNTYRYETNHWDVCFQCPSKR